MVAKTPVPKKKKVTATRKKVVKKTPQRKKATKKTPSTAVPKQAAIEHDRSTNELTAIHGALESINKTVATMKADVAESQATIVSRLAHSEMLLSAFSDEVSDMSSVINKGLISVAEIVSLSLDKQQKSQQASEATVKGLSTKFDGVDQLIEIIEPILSRLISIASTLESLSEPD